MDKLEETFKEVSKKIIESKKYLTELDSAIGDGDHGINMARGFKEVKKELEENEFESSSNLLKKISMRLISQVGGASGPLYGTAFLKASQTVEEELSLENMVEVGKAVIDGIQQRGSAELEDKTMLDAIIPAVNSLEESYEAGENLETALKKCQQAAEQGMKNTIPLVAKKGRASYLGDRSKGHQDPGATSSYIIIKTMIEKFLQ